MWATRTKRAALFLAAFTLSTLAMTVPAASAAGEPKLQSSVKIDGRDPATVTTNDPLKLSPAKGADFALRVTNPGTRPVTVTFVRLQGRVMGLTFFSYVTEVDLTVAPGATGERAFHVNLSDLKGQATGLVPAEFALLDADRKVLASDGFPVDVRGRITSIYGEFGLAVAAVTLLWVISLVFRIATRRMPENRWRRAMQCAAAGFGFGLTLTFTLSALRLLSPNAATWAPMVFGCGGVALIVGYFTPGPRHDEEDDLTPIPGIVTLGAKAAPPQQHAGEPAVHPEPQEGDLAGVLGFRPTPELGGTTVKPVTATSETVPPSSPPPSSPPSNPPSAISVPDAQPPINLDDRGTVSLPADGTPRESGSDTVQVASPGQADSRSTVATPSDEAESGPGRS